VGIKLHTTVTDDDKDTGDISIYTETPSGTGTKGKVYLQDLADPVNDNDAATKKYVDDHAGGGSGDMEKATYDTNDNGIVDNAEKVNNLTVETAVPSGAVFTDTQLTDSEVKTAYENNANTNAFTDAEKTLLGNQSGTNTGDQDLSGLALKVMFLSLTTQRHLHQTMIMSLQQRNMLMIIQILIR
jgi:hypothetical protein